MSDPQIDVNLLSQIVDIAFKEDLGDGDHSTLACIPEKAMGVAELIVKEDGILAGVELAKLIVSKVDESAEMEIYINDGDKIKVGDVAFRIKSTKRAILSSERIILNFMQRMSGIATQTDCLLNLIREYPTVLLDTRKTTPGIRLLEKWAVRIGGGTNHRFGLYDMVMLKDNHIDYSGGVENAIQRANDYLVENNLNLKIEIEVRSFEELKKVLKKGGVQRIMLDNFSPKDIKTAIECIPKEYEIEASGGITLSNIVEYAKTGVQFISVGALTHSVKSLDLSLKVVRVD